MHFVHVEDYLTLEITFSCFEHNKKNRKLKEVCTADKIFRAHTDD